MKALLFIFLLSLLYSCSHDKPVYKIKETVSLIDGSIKSEHYTTDEKEAAYQDRRSKLEDSLYAVYQKQ